MTEDVKNADANAPKKLRIQRRTKTTVSSTTAGGKAKAVQVEVRKKRTVPTDAARKAAEAEKLKAQQEAEKKAAEEEALKKANIEDRLLNLEGMNRHIAFKLAEKQITTLEELAEQGVDDLADIEELTAEQAADFIMAARNICWFSEE